MAPRRPQHSSALLAAQRALDSQDKHRQSIQQLQATTKILAESLTNDDDKGIGNALDASMDHEISAFLDTCRNKLRMIGEGNARRMKQMDCFVGAVTQVKQDMERRQQHNNDDEAIQQDYEQAIRIAMETLDATSSDDVSTHPMTIEMRTALGDTLPSSSVDDELEIVHHRGGDTIHTLKCPITGMLFEQPVKSKECGHTYSKAGLAQLIKNRKKTCPVAGCRNKTLSMAKVEDDEEMRMKVNRFRKREEQEKKKKELEHEEEMVGEGGFTMIQ